MAAIVLLVLQLCQPTYSTSTRMISRQLADSSSYYSSSSSNNRNRLSNFQICEDSVVAITSVQVFCDSPYTFYYGNGAHRNSLYCEKGDKLTINATATVTDDIYRVHDYYMTLSVYDDQQNLLYAGKPTYFCQNYAGTNCNYAGDYSFQISKLKLSNYNSGDSSSSTSGSYNSNNGKTSFIPTIKIAFSTEDDAGYNLGAMNIDCEDWESYQDSILERQRTSPDFLERNGIILITSFLVFAAALFVARQAYVLRKEAEQQSEHGFMNCGPFLRA